MNIREKRRKIFWSLGALSATLTPFALVLACDEVVNDSAALSTIERAKELLSDAVTTQTVSETIDRPLTPGRFTVETINDLPGLVNKLPDFSDAGVSVGYTAHAVEGLIQVVTAKLSAGSVSEDVDITIVYVPGSATSYPHKSAAAMRLFTKAIREQTLTEQVTNHLPSGVELEVSQIMV